MRYWPLQRFLDHMLSIQKLGDIVVIQDPRRPDFVRKEHEVTSSGTTLKGNNVVRRRKDREEGGRTASTISNERVPEDW